MKFSQHRAKLFKISTIVLAISFFAQAMTAICMVFFKDLMVRFGILRAIFEIHEYNGFLLVGLIVVHLFFNFGWIKANIFKR